MASERKPRIGVTLGDPGGVAPEVVMKALASQGLGDLCVPVIIGQKHVLERTARACGLDFPVSVVANVEEADTAPHAALFECGELRPQDYELGAASVPSGLASWAWFEAAQALSAAGKLDGWVMGPINSDSIISAGIMDDINNVQPKGTFMLRMSGPLRLVPLSEHIALRDVSDDVTPGKVLDVIRLVGTSLRAWGLPQPRIAVAGINPHASFAEDVEKIAPAVAAARAEGFDVSGPISPDSVFRQTIEGRHDVVVTMYHDQGQIALKTTSFSGACTIFLGLPYVMIGIPHGSAYDIAGKGIAQHESMLAGIRTAAMLAGGKGFLAA
jgi:4-hydroxythreonine-4-phosphate dehydrogenase